MTYIKENPDWLMFEPLDGFVLNERVLEVHKLRHKFKILSGKEELNISHSNQGYKKLVAKGDKIFCSEKNYSQRQMNQYKNKGSLIYQ